MHYFVFTFSNSIVPYHFCIQYEWNREELMEWCVCIWTGWVPMHCVVSPSALCQSHWSRFALFIHSFQSFFEKFVNCTLGLTVSSCNFNIQILLRSLRGVAFAPTRYKRDTRSVNTMFGHLHDCVSTLHSFKKFTVFCFTSIFYPRISWIFYIIFVRTSQWFVFFLINGHLPHSFSILTRPRCT